MVESAAGTAERSTRARILDAALVAFADRGVEATSLDALAAVLGVRKQTILYYHPSKEALLGAVIDQAAAELALGLAGTPGSSRGATAVVDAVLRLGAQRPELLELAREVVRLGPPASTRLFAALDPLMAEAALTIPADQVLAIAAMVIGMATEVEVLRAAGIEPTVTWLRRRRRAVLAEFA